MNARPWILVVLVWLYALAVPAAAFTNPAFTPLDLVKQSDVILLLEFTGVDANGVATAKVVEVLKGKHAGKQITIDLLAGAFEAQGKQVMKLIAAGQKQALMFTGKVDEEGVEREPEEIAYLHMASPASANWQWLKLSRYEPNSWDMEKQEQYMLGLWQGGTDMLLRCVRYVLADPNADVPAYCNMQWADGGQLRLGKLEGKVRAAQPVNLAGKGGSALFIAAEGGDRLFHMDAGAFRDVTAGHGLSSRSRVFAWSDFSDDGRLDLASWDGAKLTLHLAKREGSFSAVQCNTGDALKDGCLSLSLLDGGSRASTALVAATKSWPVQLVLRPGGEVESHPLGSGEFPGKELGVAGTCLVEDFTGDGVVDVLQLCAKSGLFYKGKAAGAFAAPVRALRLIGPQPPARATPKEPPPAEGPRAACVGDYDGDGLLDVFLGGPKDNQLWHNLGGGKFFDAYSLSGPVCYLARPGLAAVQSGDFNNDGREDLLVAYTGKLAPQLFFNRGFRSFEQAYQLSLRELRILPQAQEGQQAACLGDFNGDGALDMALVLANGEVWLFPRKVDKGRNLAVVAALSLVSATPGPVNVRAYKGKRLLGAWSVRAGGPGALIGTRHPATITLKWLSPDGKAHEKRVVVTDGPVRVLLDRG